MLKVRKNILLLFTGILILFAGCSTEEDSVVVVTNNVSLLTDKKISSAVLSQEMKYNIVLPNDYYTNTERYYPVLYLFHGMGGDNSSWAEDGDVKQILQNAFNNEVVEPMVVVMPDAFNTFYVNGYQSGLQYETYFWNEFLPYIEETYRVYTTREMRYIAGLSMGGFGASYYAFTYPDKFMYCYSMSGAVEGVGSVTSSISSIIAGYDSFEELPDYTMDCGVSDNLVFESNELVHEALNNMGFVHEYIARDGIHDWVFWQKSLQMALERIGQYLIN
ncbi:alpha/beta hydrolase [Carboxylicivirga caseinilyticus]|uniref:alpha/beta hydrolase n=1 Tax=Carboxylicivirga caseinilyticus TaxID=3417572 RepID=UPI003D359370|nr:hypothetical protein [Marinilabiliaceae bacterium A049]